MNTELCYSIYNGVGIALIRKAASSSMLRALSRPSYVIIPPEVPIIAFIREPIERVQSAWRYFQDTIYSSRKETHRLPYKDFVDLILSTEPDVHWMSQAEYLKGASDLTCYLFEDLNEKWVELGLPDLPHANQSFIRKIDTPDYSYRIDDLKEYYKGDYRLRDGN